MMKDDQPPKSQKQARTRRPIERKEKHPRAFPSQRSGISVVKINPTMYTCLWVRDMENLIDESKASIAPDGTIVMVVPMCYQYLAPNGVKRDKDRERLTIDNHH